MSFAILVQRSFNSIWKRSLSVKTIWISVHNLNVDGAISAQEKSRALKLRNCLLDLCHWQMSVCFFRLKLCRKSFLSRECAYSSALQGIMGLQKLLAVQYFVYYFIKQFWNNNPPQASSFPCCGQISSSISIFFPSLCFIIYLSLVSVNPPWQNHAGSKSIAVH